MINLFGKLYSKIDQGTWEWTNGLVQWFAGHWRNTTGALGDAYHHDVWLEAGKYTVIAISNKDTGLGQYAVKIDGTTVLTVDCSATTGVNVRDEQTNIDVTTTGLHKVSIEVVSAGEVRIQAIFMFRTS